MQWYVYILFCDQKTYYVGSTDSLKRRIHQHKNRQSLYTKKFSEIQLVYTEIFNVRSKALDREKQIKGWSLAKKKALIEKDLEKLKSLSKST
mgnify:FL=1